MEEYQVGKGKGTEIVGKNIKLYKLYSPLHEGEHQVAEQVDQVPHQEEEKTDARKSYQVRGYRVGQP